MKIKNTLGSSALIMACLFFASLGRGAGIDPSQAIGDAYRTAKAQQERAMKQELAARRERQEAIERSQAYRRCLAGTLPAGHLDSGEAAGACRGVKTMAEAACRVGALRHSSDSDAARAACTGKSGSTSGSTTIYASSDDDDDDDDDAPRQKTDKADDDESPQQKFDDYIHGLRPNAD